MLFIYIHTHPVEKCPANNPQDMKKMVAKAQEDAKKAGIKMVGTYVAMHEHTVYMVVEASDMATLEKLLIPMTVQGTAKLVPVLTLEQSLTLV